MSSPMDGPDMRLLVHDVAAVQLLSVENLTLTCTNNSTYPKDDRSASPIMKRNPPENEFGGLA